MGDNQRRTHQYASQICQYIMEFCRPGFYKEMLDKLHNDRVTPHTHQHQDHGYDFEVVKFKIEVQYQQGESAIHDTMDDFIHTAEVESRLLASQVRGQDTQD